MGIQNFSTDLRVVTVNGRRLTNFGENASPVTNAPLNPKSALRIGQGGNGCRLDRIAPGRTVNIYLNPGSPDSAYMQGLYNSKAPITFTDTQIGTLENNVGTNGMITTDGEQARAGTSISDDMFTMEFLNWIGSKGGEG